jgi:hypothetical protein
MQVPVQQSSLGCETSCIFGSDILHGVKPLSETEFCQGAGATAVVGTGAVSLAPKASPPVRTARDTNATGSRAPCWQNFSGRSRRNEFGSSSAQSTVR